MDLAHYVLPADRLADENSDPAKPLVIVDLARESAARIDPRSLPPVPVIGLGPHDHPLAQGLDAVVEEGFDPHRLAASIAAMPRAAAVLVGLLRRIASLDPDSALEAESLAYAVLQGSGEHRDWLAGRRPRKSAGKAGTVKLSRAEKCLEIRLFRPDSDNAIDRAMRDGLREGLALANADPQIEEVILTAEGCSFSLGADLAEFGTTTDPATAHLIRRRTLPAHEAVRCAERLGARIDGACVGAGLELAAFARHVTATRRSWFQLPELAMGILPGAGGCVSLTRRIGRQRTALLVLSGRRLGAARAHAWGLVDDLVESLDTPNYLA